ncbi:hypothetical protein D9611_010799 [Ephemerocybe angulata]|uniref:Uncharacterized protein n=1 Tax=Ephemerocybe angulata TaxID=980116 RepID=A0A8H5F1T3_9AGAR|nr:hypothetical protein D9611_010799 [Tulosesus angulatus]
MDYVHYDELKALFSYLDPDEPVPEIAGFESFSGLPSFLVSELPMAPSASDSEECIIPSRPRNLPFIDASQHRLDHRTTPGSQRAFAQPPCPSFDSARHSMTTACAGDDSQQTCISSNGDGSVTLHQPIHQSQHSSYSELAALVNPILPLLPDKPRTEHQVAASPNSASFRLNGPFDFPETDIDPGPCTAVAASPGVAQPFLWPASVYAALQLDVPSHVMRSLPTDKLDAETKNPFGQRSDDSPTKPDRPHPYPLPRRHSQPSSAKSPAPDRSSKTSKRRSSTLAAKPPATPARTSTTPKPASEVLKTMLNQKPTPKKACFFCRERKIACGAPPPNAPDQTCKYVTLYDLTSPS